MADILTRLDAMSINLVGKADKDKLAHLMGWVLENIQLRTVSQVFKNNELSGDPAAGTMEAKRFSNVATQAYGTARTAQKGTNISAMPVIVPINIKREIIEEIENYDLHRYGIPNIIQRRVVKHVLSMITELDTAFFKEAVEGKDTNLNFTATEVKPAAGSTVRKQLEELSLSIEKTKNDFIDGVPREMIGVVLSQDKASELRLEIDSLPATDNTLANGYWTTLHGVALYTSNHLPEGVSMLGMVYGSVAQPVRITDYNPTRPPFSDATAVESFLTYGCKSVTPDLIAYVKQVVPTPEGK